MGLPINVLCVEDREDDATLLCLELRRAGYDVTYERVETAAAMRSALESRPWDVVVSDYAMPTFSAPAALEVLHEMGLDIPFIIVSGTIGEDAAVSALRAGAQDFFAKDKLARLGPAVARELREAQERQQRRQAEMNLYRYNQRLETLHALDQAILGAQSGEAVARFALQGLLQRADIAGASISTFSFESRQAVVYTATKGDDPIPAGAGYALEEWLPESIAALRTGEIQVIEDSTAGAHLPPGLRSMHAQGRRSFLCVPLLAKNELLGALTLAAAGSTTLTDEFVDIAREIAAQVAIAVHSAQLYDQVQSHATELERRVVERTAELQRAKERAETILNNSSDAVAMTWLDGRVQQTNPAFNRLFGYEVDEAVGQPLVPLAAPEQQQAMADALQSVVAGGQSSQVEINNYPGDGLFFDAEVVFSPILGEGQRVSGVVCIVHDMTKRNQVQRELQELNQLKTEFLSTAAHELRTPLTSIQGFSEILLTRTLAESRQAYYLGLINAQALQLGELINDLLDIARLEGNRSLSLDLQPVNVNDLLDEVLMPFTETSSLHQFQRVSPEQLPPVVADRFRLGQVFKNLISNAVKYSPKGGAVTIRCQRQPEVVQVNIRDEGIGMTRAQLAHVFEKFYRADASNTAIIGTGLGLAISKLIIELHGGQIWVESEDGCCTSITFTLPLRDEAGNVT